MVEHSFEIYIRYLHYYYEQKDGQYRVRLSAISIALTHVIILLCLFV